MTKQFTDYRLEVYTKSTLLATGQSKNQKEVLRLRVQTQKNSINL